ncbi:hypothetical protein EYF80_003976 [Liparis tanakae]|uniref:Uncharacterized protein n=1 Tax=Liparis tanakae TaxID=230148 RepID=A0A4Z2J6A4_9TELE|nr:hypothetical protein EYF80_003976 [Liparis tanakae]
MREEKSLLQLLLARFVFDNTYKVTKDVVKAQDMFDDGVGGHGMHYNSIWEAARTSSQDAVGRSQRKEAKGQTRGSSGTLFGSDSP